MDEKLIQRLIDKSCEAFIMGLEIYNKPTLQYRVEGFAFFICNAWELMLKAKLLKDGKSIYFGDNGRTISLSSAIKKIYTDKRQPLRVNLEEIIKLRDTSTHFVTEDYELFYAPLFQSCVTNFCTQIKRFHGVNMADKISQNFLVLPIRVNYLSDDEIRGKYSKEMAERLIAQRTEIEFLEQQIKSPELAIPIRHEFYQTKDAKQADFTYAIDNSSSEKVKVIKQEIDPSNKYTLSVNAIIKTVNNRLVAENIRFNYITSAGKNEFNSYVFNLFVKFYDIKNDRTYCYSFAKIFRYSPQTVDLIIDTIKGNPDIVESIKKKIAPGS